MIDFAGSEKILELVTFLTITYLHLGAFHAVPTLPFLVPNSNQEIKSSGGDGVEVCALQAEALQFS